AGRQRLREKESHTSPRPGAGVAFLLPQPLAAGEKLEGFLCWADKSSPQAPASPASDLSVKPDSRGLGIENSRLRLLIGGEGAHVYKWLVKALGNIDVTDPGLDDWHGFLDVNTFRRTRFDLKVLASGPVMAFLQASEPGGFEKCVVVYSSLPIVELYTIEPVTWLWNYDNPRNFAADAPQPGRGRLADGTEKPVPASSERVHIEPKKPVRWCAKWRPDGLTLGLITPATDTNMRIGPGDGWGGVGVERSAPADWFVVYCDKTPQVWRAVAGLAAALRPDGAPKVTVGDLGGGE
ncbi:MAG: hypothetical protein J7M26_07895, partial [Armatimonadetes bacterium]|nr:hypothetical protein [Armatimonadota bacterium]